MNLESALSNLNQLNNKIEQLRTLGRSIEFKVNGFRTSNDEDVFAWFKCDGIPLTFSSEQEALDKIDRLLGA